MRHLQQISAGRRLGQISASFLGAIGMTLTFFLVLPFIQSISATGPAELIVQSVDTASLPPPPPPPPEEEREPEPEEEQEPPELMETPQPLDLSQLELALSPGFGDGWGSGDFSLRLDTVSSSKEDVDALFALADLDQKPRPLYQPSPVVGAALRKKAPGTVNILFIVDQDGRVQNPIVQSSSDSVFERPALAAVKQWKFEPGKRNGAPVRFRMRVPITFPEG